MEPRRCWGLLRKYRVGQKTGPSSKFGHNFRPQFPLIRPLSKLRTYFMWNLKHSGESMTFLALWKFWYSSVFHLWEMAVQILPLTIARKMVKLSITQSCSARYCWNLVGWCIMGQRGLTLVISREGLAGRTASRGNAALIITFSSNIWFVFQKHQEASSKLTQKKLLQAFSCSLCRLSSEAKSCAKSCASLEVWKLICDDFTCVQKLTVVVYT